MQKKHWALVGLLVYLVALLGLMITDWRPGQGSQKPIRVVTSLDFYGEAASAVAGKYGQVTSLINSAATDPHDYQPTTKQAKQVSQANLVIQNGLGYDHWLTSMVKATSAKQTVITVGSQVAGHHAGANEHVWYQPGVMAKLTSRLATAYGKLDPSHRAYYQARARAYRKQLAKLSAVIKQAKANVTSGQKVAVSEPVFDYALKNLGYQIIDSHFEKAIEDGNDPSPADIQQLQTAIKEGQIAFFVNNSQTSNTTVKNLVKLAKAHGVPVLNVTETKPDNQTYIEWLTSEYRQLIKIQKEAN